MLDQYGLLYFLLGVIFAVITAVEAYQKAPLEHVHDADQKQRDTACKAESLRKDIAALWTRYTKSYQKGRSKALEITSEARNLCQLFVKTADRHCELDFPPFIPALDLPTEFESTDPPPLSTPSVNSRQVTKEGVRV